jgi:hypothetical protein
LKRLHSVVYRHHSVDGSCRQSPDVIGHVAGDGVRESVVTAEVVDGGRWTVPNLRMRFLARASCLFPFCSEMRE